jgi:hypothetical protein
MNGCMSKKKRGMMQQVFIYILAVLVIGFILIIGLNSFGKIDKTRCLAEKTTFQRDLMKTIDDNVVWGREQEVSLTKPCDYEVLCFVDARSIKYANIFGTTFEKMTDLKTTSPYTLGDQEHNIIKNSVLQKIEKNIFLIKKNTVEPIDYAGQLYVINDAVGTGYCTPPDATCPTQPQEIDGMSTKIPQYAFCIPSRAGKFTFTLQGQGRSVVVRP